MKQTTLNFLPSLSYLASDFVVSDCNAMAKNLIDAWPDWPSHGLMLIGAEASGKTHLAKIWMEKAGALQVTAEDDLSHIIHQPLCVDNADTWKDHQGQAKLFHLLNMAKEQPSHILLTASSVPSQWEITLLDLKSRLNALPQAWLNPPDEALLSALLSKHFHDRQIHVDADVIHYIVARQERSFAETHRIAQQLDQTALEHKRSITIAFTRQVLGW